MPRRRKDKIDSNQNEIVNALLSIPGVSVETGHDDIIVGYKGQNFWFEIKTPESVSRKTGKIKDSSKKPYQKLLEKDWSGHYKIVSDIGDILNDIL